MSGPVADPGRRDALAAALAGVRGRIAAGCRAAGRDPGEVTLIAVTKTWPVTDIAALADLGLRDIGENRDQEARPKWEALRDRDIAWHFVGQLQRRRCRSVAQYATTVHSVDRLVLVPALDRALVEGGRRAVALVQVSLDGDPARGGAVPGDVPAVAAAVAAATALDLGGVMAVAPLGADPDRVFARLADIAASLQAEHPGARIISAGMSGDLEAALRNGATHVRIGSALLGVRRHEVR